MNQRVLPEWSKDELEYVEPTQVVRSFGYDVFANEVSEEALGYNEQTVARVLQVDGEVAPEKRDYSGPEAAAEDIKQAGLEAGAEMVGITEVNPYHIYKGHDVPHKYAVILASRMDYDEMKHGATERHVREVLRSYAEMGSLSARVAAYIRSAGYPARAHSLRFEQINMIPHAIQAGLGQLGKHGSLINDRLGCSFRLSAVTTDLPMKLDSFTDYGVEDTCLNCSMCVKHCPGDAIVHEKQVVRGALKWVVDTEACAPYWGSYHACGICLEVCPANVKAFGGKYKNSFIERIKQIDLKQRRQELTEGLQQPWDNAVEPDDKSEGWRNRVRGQGHAAFLMQGIPSEGLPEEIYEIRSAMGIRPATGQAS